ncbi:MAG TPA: transposase, partial [bacterium]
MPTAGRSQSFETYQDAQRSLDAGDFDTSVDEQTGQLTVNACPNHQIPKDQQRSEKTEKVIVHFDPDVCCACPDAQRCPVKVGKRVATYNVDEAEYIGTVRHHQYMSNRDYRKACAIRAGVEATVSELTRAHGLRKSRHRAR